MSNDKMRGEFEASYTAYCHKLGWKTYTAFHMLSEVYVRESTELAWQMWQASREALVIELPAGSSLMGRMYGKEGGGIPLVERHVAVAAIEAAGVKVKR